MRALMTRKSCGAEEMRSEILGNHLNTKLGIISILTGSSDTYTRARQSVASQNKLEREQLTLTLEAES